MGGLPAQDLINSGASPGFNEPLEMVKARYRNALYRGIGANRLSYQANKLRPIPYKTMI